MDRSIRDRGFYVFGPFRLDAARRELRRDGEVISVRPTVFDTLLYLVEHPGRVVTKDELLDAIWPRRLVGESNISQTIFSLRKILGDDGETQRMIVTAPGQGYRFTPAVALEVGEAAPAGVDFINPLTDTSADRAAGFWRRIAPWGVLGGVVALCLLLGAVALSLWRPPSSPPARTLAVIADFQNNTGDPIFDRTLAKALEIDLLQSPLVTVLSERRVASTLALMTRPPEAPLTPSLAEEVCARNAGQAVLEGSVGALGGGYLLTLKATDCTGDAMAADKVEISRRDQVIAGLDTLAARMRRRLGESAGSIRRFDVPLARERTASLEALKAYTDGRDQFNRGKRLESVALFQHAVALDPNFAIAYDALASAYVSTHQRDLAEIYAKKAYALRDTVGENERFQITAHYEGAFTKNFDAVLRNLRLWTETYPGDGTPWASLADAENWIGRYPEAIAAGRRAVALAPDKESSYVVLARALMHAGRVDEASLVCGQSVARGLAGDDTHGLLLEIAFAKADEPGVQRELAWAHGKPAETYLTIISARHAYRLGQVRRGEALFAAGAALAKEQGVKDFTLPPRARELYDLGLVDQARALLDRVPPETDSNDYRFDLAEMGDPTRARAWLDNDLKKWPTDTMLNAVSASEVRAALDLRIGRPAAAVEALKPAAPYEAKVYDVPYLRGRAFLAAGDGRSAAAEFRKILGASGLEPTSPLYPLARLGLARALRMAGDIPASRVAYQTLFQDWRNADADLPALTQARAEYARL